MRERIYSINTLRAIAIFFVVVAHTHPFHAFGAYGNHIYFLLDTIGQFDVPFFFVTAGYFLAKKMNPANVRSVLVDSTRKLGSMYLFGMLFYTSVIATLTIGTVLIYGRDVVSALVARLLEGISFIGVVYYGDSITVPLWFLTALLFSTGFVSLFVVFERTRYLLPVAAGTHVLGLIGQNFPMLVDVPFPTRDALFFGFFYVTLGFRIRSADWKPDQSRSRLYLSAVVVLVIIQLLEQYAVSYLLRDHTLNQGIFTTEYTVSTVFLVLAIFAYALSNPNWGKGTVLPKVGTYAVGIYLIHAPIYETFKILSNLLKATAGISLRATVLWHVLIAPVVFVLSLAVYFLVARIGIVEIGGSHLPRLARVRARLGTSKLETSSTAD